MVEAVEGFEANVYVMACLQEVGLSYKYLDGSYLGESEEGSDTF